MRFAPLGGGEGGRPSGRPNTLASTPSSLLGNVDPERSRLVADRETPRPRTRAEAVDGGREQRIQAIAEASRTAPKPIGCFCDAADPNRLRTASNRVIYAAGAWLTSRPFCL